MQHSIQKRSLKKWNIGNLAWEDSRKHRMEEVYMGKRRCMAWCMALFMALMAPMEAFGADADTGESDMAVGWFFHPIAGKAGEATGPLRSGESKKDVTDFEDYLKADPVVAISASMDGQADSSLYWSQKEYQAEDGKAERIAVLKAEEGNPWGTESEMILKVEDIRGSVCGIKVLMGASEDGPRDFKIAYSLDQGQTWEEYSSLGTDRGSIREAGKAAAIFRKNTMEIDRRRAFEERVLVNKTFGEYETAIYGDIYFRIRVDSDYKVNGEKGLYGSSSGEWGIQSVKLLDGILYPALEPELKPAVEAPVSVSAYKTGAAEITLRWKKSSNADGYEIYLKKGNGGFKKARTFTKGSVGKYVIKGLSPNAAYKLRVRPYRKEGREKSYGSYTKAITVNMKKQPLLNNLSLKKSVSIKKGKKGQISVKCTEGTSSKYIKNVSYRVRDPKIASVSTAGVVKGKQKGSTEATVRVVLKNGQKKSFTVKLKVG